MPCTVAILAGGRSARMGADKASVCLAGISMLERVARTALPLASSLVILGRDGAPAGWPGDLVARFVPDVARGRFEAPAGPMPALAALLKRGEGTVLLLACDTPLLTTQTLRQLLGAHASQAVPPRATLAVMQDADGSTFAQPTLAVYTPAVLPTLERLMADKRGSFQPLLREPGIHSWSIPPDRRDELLNINTPEALAEAESFLRQRPGPD